MTPERWRQIDDLFDTALHLAPGPRGDWLRRACDGDETLRAEVDRLLAQDDRAERDGFLAPPGRTPTWPPPGAILPPASPTRDFGPEPTVDGFTPKAAIVRGQGFPPTEEGRRTIQARLRELPIIYALIFGVMGVLRPFLLGHLDPTVVYLNAAGIAFLVGISAVLSSRPFPLATLRSLELGMIGMLAGLVAHYQYRLLLRLSLEDDPGSAQLVMKNVVLLVSLLILTFGIYVPKSWRRAAAVSGPLALLPIGMLAALYLGHPGPMGWLFRMQRRSVPIVLFGLDAVFLLTLAAVSAFGAHTISRLRREVVEARQLGQYRLGRRIGVGGMGEVYLAEHQLLKRPCAVKLIRTGGAVDPRTLDRFEREVRLTATLSHWNTVEIFDYGRTEDGTYYYVMEYLPGMSLAELVDRHGPLPPGRAVYLLRQVCLSLREAHAMGLIHRDVKPSNIFAARRGGMDDVAKLLDFGLVRPTAAPPDPRLSAEGQILGTPLFMSPEQATGRKEIDARSDIYSLGAVAYYILTGRPPFDEGSGIGTLIAHARDPVVPPSSLRPEVPDDLEAVVLRCLAKDPDDRFQDAESLERALAACPSALDWDQDSAALWWRDSGWTP